MYTPAGGVTQTNTAKLTAVLGGQIGTDIALQGLASPQQNQAMKLYLELQNGDFVALRDSYDSTHDMLMAFNTAGEIHWIKPIAQYSSTPLYALASGGMVYREGFSPNQQLVTLDAGGNELSRVTDPGTVQSWIGSTYRTGSTILFQDISADKAKGFAAEGSGNPSHSGTAAVAYESPLLGLFKIASTSFLSQQACSTFLDNLTSRAIQNGRAPEGSSFSRQRLISEIQSAAATAGAYVHDGPSSNTNMGGNTNQCYTQNCVAKFPYWLVGTIADGYTVGKWFDDHNVTGDFVEGLSQYEGSFIWLRLDSWQGGWKGLFSEYVDHTGHVGAYGLGTLLHEVLHKRSVGGGFTHADLSWALGLSGECLGEASKNSCSWHIATSCFAGN